MTVGAAAACRKADDAVERKALDRDDVVIGKDVLELLSSAMYVDPMSVYREYVQNAADAIDAARTERLLGPDDVGTITIDIEPASRTVTIRDNGTGIGRREFPRRMTALGGSVKRGAKARGFRGVGRLAGLGYAQELVFRSRVQGEILASEIRWDCRRLRAALRELDDRDLVEIIRDAVTVGRVARPDHPDRFFEVEMKGAVRQRSDNLMNPEAVAAYLSQVAPIPFLEAFRFRSEITAALSRHLPVGDLDIRVSGIEGPLRRPHGDGFGSNEGKGTAYKDLQVVEVPGTDGEIAAVGWVLHHDYDGAVPSEALVKGLRFRSGNIQVGDHTLLDELFPETRFNSWSVGEIHVLDRRIVPNGRRDHFEQNTHYYNLVNHLTPTAREIARRCRTGSIRRKWLRDFEMHRRAATEKLAILKQGALGTAERQAMSLAIEQVLMQMERIASMALLGDDALDELHDMAARVRSELAAAMSDRGLAASPLARLPTERRAMYEHLFELVYECSANRSAAKALVDRILLKVT